MIAFVFPGQGAQKVGMGKALADVFPVCRDTFAEADAALGEPLSRLCFGGPEDRLMLTEHTQPAVLAVSTAAARIAMQRGLTPSFAAGHSLGEYAAHVAAGTLPFADAVRLVRERATAMQRAVPAGTGGMVVLRKMNLDEVKALVARVDAGLCELANVNEPEQIVVSGAIAAMDQVVALAPPRKALKLNVSVPFHCSLLKDAAVAFGKRLDATAMRDPAFAVWCNVDAAPVTTAAAARSALQRQFAGAVQWQATIEGMFAQGVRQFVECGPKPTLVNMVKRIAVARGVDGVETVAATTADEIAALLAK